MGDERWGVSKAGRAAVRGYAHFVDATHGACALRGGDSMKLGLGKGKSGMGRF